MLCMEISERGFSVNEKWAGTAWAAAPQFDSASRPIGSTKVTRLENGNATVVTAKVFANCDISVFNPSLAVRKTCNKNDVKRYGGSLTMRAESVDLFGETRRTDFVIQSEDLTYGQIVAIAANMKKVDW